MLVLPLARKGLGEDGATILLVLLLIIVVVTRKEFQDRWRMGSLLVGCVLVQRSRMGCAAKSDTDQQQVNKHLRAHEVCEHDTMLPGRLQQRAGGADDENVGLLVCCNVMTRRHRPKAECCSGRRPSTSAKLKIGGISWAILGPTVSYSTGRFP